MLSEYRQRLTIWSRAYGWRVGVAVPTALAPLLLGGVHVEVNLLLAALAWLGFVSTALTPKRGGNSDPKHRWQMLILLALGLVSIVACVLQTIALPLDWIEKLQPGAYDVLAFVGAGKRETGALSVDPPATHHEIIKLLMYLCCFLNIAQTSSSPERRVFISKTIGLSGGLVVLIGYAHFLAGVGQSFGRFGGHDYFSSTLVNPNNLSAYLGVVLCAQALCLQATAQRSHRVLWSTMLILTVGAILLIGSRGGILFLSFTLFVGWFIWLLRPHSRASTRSHIAPFHVFFRRSHVTLAPLYFVLAFVLTLIGVSSFRDEMASLLEPQALAKTKAWYAFSSIFKDYWLTGAGRGATGSVYPRYDTLRTFATVTHFENEYLQILADMGIVVGTLLIFLIFTFGALSFFILLRTKSRPSRNKARLKEDAEQKGETPKASMKNSAVKTRISPAFLTHLLVCMLVLFMLLQVIFDFSTELPGVSLPLIVLCSAVYGGTWRFSHRKIVFISASILGLLFYSCAGAWGKQLQNDTERVKDLIDQGLSKAELSEAFTIVERHPGDYFLPLLLASGLDSNAKRGREQLYWANASILRAPAYQQPHRFAGRALLKLGAKKQALEAYSHACAVMPEILGRNAGVLAKEFLERSEDLNLYARYRCGDIDVAPVLAHTLRSRKRPDLALQVLEDTSSAVYSVSPGAGFYRLFEKEAALRQSKRLEEALGVAQELVAQFPQRPGSFLVLSRAQLNANGWQSAAATAKLGLHKHPNNHRLYPVLISAQTKLKEVQLARATALRWLHLAIDHNSIASANLTLAKQALAHNDHVTALNHLNRSLEAKPQQVHALALLLRSYRHIGSQRLARIYFNKWLNANPAMRTNHVVVDLEKIYGPTPDDQHSFQRP
jgi:tetratricopeptide (TPR) repeat protein